MIAWLGKETRQNFGMESFVKGVAGRRRKIREIIIKKNLRPAGYGMKSE